MLRVLVIVAAAIALSAIVSAAAIALSDAISAPEATHCDDRTEATTCN